MGTDRLTDEEADMMLKIADKDGDGVLEYEEIVAILASDVLEHDPRTPRSARG